MNYTRILALLVFSFAAVSAHAQDMGIDDQAHRVDRLERDIMLLQRQLARDETPDGPQVTGIISNPAQLEVRLSNMEDELRTLRGRVEESEFRSKQTAEMLEKFQRDVEFRFKELQQAPGAATETPVAAPAPEPITVDKVEPKSEKVIEVATKTEVPEQPTTGGDGVLRAPQESDEFASPRDHYNYAFRLLNQTKYAEAAAAFADFISKYPKDPLIGNAYYWQGETFYIRRDYVNAADHFRLGFEALPEGPKAADNLLKLAMSLDALERSKEACVVLNQILVKFKNSSTNVIKKATKERKRIGCNG